MENKKVWWIIIIILGLLALALWMFNWRLPEIPPIPLGNNTSSLKTQNTAELSSIENDLNATDINNLTSDLPNLDKEISAK